MFNGNSPSLADIAAVTGNNRDDGFLGGDGIWAIIVFAMIFGWGGFGNGWGNGGNGGATPFATGALTQTDLQRGFDTQAIVGKLDGISNGICDGFYAVNNSMLTGFNGINTSLNLLTAAVKHVKPFRV